VGSVRATPDDVVSDGKGRLLVLLRGGRAVMSLTRAAFGYDAGRVQLPSRVLE
jgi:hypothetical protein